MSGMTTPSLLLPTRYPLGPMDTSPAPEGRAPSIAAIRALPAQFASAYQGLTEEQLETPYREAGWTLRQLAHHLADSHINAFVRVKLALTEDWPAIRPYDEKLWALTPEVHGPVDAPLAVLAGLHARWAALFEGLDESQWQRGYLHPESGRLTLTQVAALYSWHGRHHTAHAAHCRARMGW